MEVELVTSGISEEETFEVYDDTEDSSFGDERCGICMDLIVDRGVLDCCQHWFCFGCIDNWATITNLCPLCQNEFQLITCVPVYDTIGSSKVDEDSLSRDDDWSIEGKNNTLSFPSYYIDENAVTCLAGEGCKIRSGSDAIGEDSNVDTSIACDSCDIWYHAFCVGFDPESTSDNSWLCPRCVINEMPHKSDLIFSNRREEIATGGYSVESGFSGKVSVSVADAGETAVVVSLVERSQQQAKEPSETLPLSFDGYSPIRETPYNTGITSIKSDLDEQGLELSLSQDKTFVLCNDKSSGNESSTGRHLGLSVGSFLSVDNTNDAGSGDSLLSADRTGPGPNGDAGSIKPKQIDCSDHILASSEDGETTAIILAEVSTKRMKTEESIMMIPSEDRSHNSGSDIMSIVQGTDRRPNLCDKVSKKERENAAKLRVKKIMRRAEDKDSSMLVQNLRREIREAVRNKSSEDIGKDLFDPKLLAAFRAAIAGPITESMKKPPPLVVKAKKSMLRKGKVRENLTKKIYGNSCGKRRRAWDRDCEIEFWKHRCLYGINKPEKVETLKSVLDLLRTDTSEINRQGSGKGKESNSILSRLYLADSSVFPRKDNIKPLSALEENTASSETSKENKAIGKAYKPFVVNKTPQTSKLKSKGIDSKGTKTTAPSLKGELAQKVMAGKDDDIRNNKRKWALEVLARKTTVVGKNSAPNDEDNAALNGNYPLLAQLPNDMRPAVEPSRQHKIPVAVRQTQLYRLAEHFLRKANLPVIKRTAVTELAIADAVNIEKEIASKSNSKLVYVNLCSQELLHRADNNNSNTLTREREQEDYEASADPVVEDALRNAGLLSDSPPNSPSQQINDPNTSIDGNVNGNDHDHDRDGDRLMKIGEEDGNDNGTRNVLDMNSHPELDIYGDFEYDLEDEDYIGTAGLANVAKAKPEGGESKVKLVFSTLNSDKPNESPKNTHFLGLLEKETEKSCLPIKSSFDEGCEEPSLAECEELYGPDKEPLIKKFPGMGSKTPSGIVREDKITGENGNYGSTPKTKESEFESESCAENAIHCSSGGENSPNHSQIGGDVDRKEKKFRNGTKKKSDSSSSVSRKVEAYIKEHIRPLCKSGVITTEQYRWAVGKTTDKVMKYHYKAKDASFLIKEGEKVKKLAEQYVEAAAAEKKEKKN